MLLYNSDTNQLIGRHKNGKLSMEAWGYYNGSKTFIYYRDNGPAKIHYLEDGVTVESVDWYNVFGWKVPFDEWADFDARCSKADLIELKLKYA